MRKGNSSRASGDSRKSSSRKNSRGDSPRREKSSSFSKSSSRSRGEKKGPFKSSDKGGKFSKSDDKAGRYSKPSSPRFSGDEKEKRTSRYSKPGGRKYSSDESERPTRPTSRFSKPTRGKFTDKDSSDKSEKRTGKFSKPGERTSRFDKKPSTSRVPKSDKFSSSGEKRYKKNPTKSFSKERETKPEYNTTLQTGTEKIRLNKYIANSGVCSRREADELILMGLVTVNDKAITELGYKVNPGDVVKYEGKILRAEKPVYILINKPKGYLTTTKDPQERNTVMHILGNAVKERVYPVGRLDRNTTGLLLLTNDGDLAEKLSHPSYNVKKIYKVELDRPLTKNDYQKIMEGVQLEEGRAMVDDLAIVSEDGKTVGMELHIGWNRVVRRIFESLQYTVVKLDRSVYAGLDKKDLARGEWRFLKKEELVRLKHFK